MSVTDWPGEYLPFNRNRVVSGILGFYQKVKVRESWSRNYFFMNVNWQQPLYPILVLFADCKAKTVNLTDLKKTISHHTNDVKSIT